MPEPVDGSHIVQVAVRVADDEKLRRLLADPSVDFGCRASGARGPDGTVRVDAFVPASMVTRLREAGYAVEVVADVTANIQERAAEVGRADLFERGRPSRRGLVQDPAIPHEAE